MKKKTSLPPPPIGDQKAVDIYLAVGIALTSWEACEDDLVGVFRTLCAGKEPTLFETYIASSRKARADMLRRAMKQYSYLFVEGEAENLLGILKALDTHAQTRNEIAHGYCVDIEHGFEGKLRMKGFYLLPSLHAGIRLDRNNVNYDYKFSHTSQTMNAFSSVLAPIRTEIQTIMFALMDRVNAEAQARAKLISAGIAQQHKDEKQ